MVVGLIGFGLVVRQQALAGVHDGIKVLASYPGSEREREGGSGKGLFPSRSCPQ
jgi:hypothetical protein